MSMQVVLQQENGTKLSTEMGDAGHTLLHLLVSRSRESSVPFHYLPYIDPYGDTIFNCLQAEPLLEELSRLRTFELNGREVELLDGVEAVVRACKNSNRLYVRFLGD